MRKKLLIWHICVLVTFVGCSNMANKYKATEDLNVEMSTQTKVERIYLIENNKQNIISVQIPIIDGGNAEQVPYIQNYLAQKLYEMSGVKFNLSLSEEDIQDKDVEYLGYYISIKSSISYVSDDLISIVFEGLYNCKTAAHPINWFFTLNYNPQTLEIINFSDKYLIDEALYNVFVKYAERSIREECDGIWPENWGAFNETLCSKKSFINGMKNEVDFYYYHTRTGIVISYPVPHALGDHKEVEIPYEFLIKYN